MAEPLIELEEVGLTLPSLAGDVEILRGISLTVSPGETVAIIGPSGSGKSSLLMVMGGLERATSGTAKALGQDLGRLDEDGLARLRAGDIGVVFQSFHLIPTMTALENVAAPLEIAGMRGAREKAREALGRVGLAAREGHLPAQMSGGEQQRVALARATVAGPKLLLADEPTGNLDTSTGQQIMDLLFGLAETQGATLVIVTHERVLAERCDRIVSLEDGHIVTDERRAAA